MASAGRRGRCGVRASGAALLAALLAACAAGPPSLKPGLWEIRGDSLELPAQQMTQYSYSLCRDHAYDRATNAQVKSVKGCTTLEKALGKGKFSSASRCDVAGVTILSTGTSAFKKKSSAHMETHAVYQPALNGKTEETITQDQRYVGKCPAGMKPGERVNAQGFVYRHDDPQR